MRTPFCFGFRSLLIGENYATLANPLKLSQSYS
jgi:hypothetical protein